MKLQKIFLDDNQQTLDALKHVYMVLLANQNIFISVDVPKPEDDSDSEKDKNDSDEESLLQKAGTLSSIVPYNPGSQSNTVGELELPPDPDETP